MIPRMPEHFYSEHAIDRAWERYGLTLSSADMAEIWRACHDGRASRMRSSSDGGATFVWRFKGKIIIPTLIEARHFIVTFNPIEHFTTTARRSRRLGKRKTVAATSKHVTGRPYNRAKAARETTKGGST